MPMAKHYSIIKGRGQYPVNKIAEVRSKMKILNDRIDKDSL
jgi:hypothetical protein